MKNILKILFLIFFFKLTFEINNKIADKKIDKILKDPKILFNDND